MKEIVILGVTGSIGTQSIDVIINHPHEYHLLAMSAGRNIAKLEEIIAMTDCKIVCVSLEEDRTYLVNKYPNLTVLCGEDGLIKIATLQEANIVLNAIVGFAGLKPTIEAIKAKKDIALANKETLVVAGHIIMKLVKKYNVKLLPVDSEHSAIFQSLNGENPKEIKRLIITASGGSFRDKTLEELKDVSVEEALNHPNWSMGAKITIDSATMFNKGLEVMEASWLYDIDYDHIDVLIHPQSVVHSMVEFIDTSVIAQLGTPDMRLPIQYALSYPHRIELMNAKSLNLAEIGSLTFREMDHIRFKPMALAYKAGRTGGSLPCVLNGANEQAVDLFLKGKIKFLRIVDMVEEVMNVHEVIKDPSLEQLIEIDNWAREEVLKRV